MPVLNRRPAVSFRLSALCWSLSVNSTACAARSNHSLQASPNTIIIYYLQGAYAAILNVRISYSIYTYFADGLTMYCLNYVDVCVCVCVYVVIYVYYLANTLSMFYSVFIPSFYDVIYKIFKHYALVSCAGNNSA